MEQIGFGGSCHWCTEAIFLSLRGIIEVLQGWIADAEQTDRFSEAVLVTFDPEIISLQELTAIHLYTHSCTSSHAMRDKYRSAVYCFNAAQIGMVKNAMLELQENFPAPIITETVMFGQFRLNTPEYQNYYYKDIAKPFCTNIINPKLNELISRFSNKVDLVKLTHLTS